METETFYLLGYWSNAYSRNEDREYFWATFDTRQEALAYGKRKQDKGQPKRFYDWAKGTNRCFSSKEGFIVAANKVGLNPRFSE